MKKRNRKRRTKRTRSKRDQQYTRLSVPPEQRQSSSTFLAHTFIWIGSTLSAFTFLGGLQTVIDFSPWASWLLRTWLTAAEHFWRKAFELSGQNFERDSVVPLTFIFAMIAVGFGAMILEFRQDPHRQDKRQPSFWDVVLDQEINLRRIEGLAIGLTISLATVSVVNWYIFESSLSPNDFIFGWIRWITLGLTPVLFLILFFVRSRRDYLHLLLLTASMTLLYVVMLIPAAASAKARGDDELWRLAFMVVNVSAIVFPTKMMAILTLAQARFWNYRLLHIWLTIGLVLLLDWVAQSSISLKPPP